MEENKMIEYPQIRYHITYDESITLKDLEDLINLIRVSVNDVFEEIGISRPKANALQKIQKIEPGSIEIIMGSLREILAIAGDIAGVIGLIGGIATFIRNRIIEKREHPERSPKADKKVYDKYDVITEIEERISYSEDNEIIYVIHIHICNRI